jgi:small subunit ribosomal protein S2
MIPGNDDAMRAAELYAIAVADAVLEGKASIPALPVGEDDFVELDAEGRPKSSPEGRRPVAAKRPARKPGSAPASAPRGRAKSAKAAGSAEVAPAAGESGGAEEAPAAGDTEAQA